MFTLRDDDGKIVAVLSSNVDDLLYGHMEEAADAMNSGLEHFNVRVQNQDRIRFCGKEVVQHDDYSIIVRERKIQKEWSRSMFFNEVERKVVILGPES